MNQTPIIVEAPDAWEAEMVRLSPDPAQAVLLALDIALHPFAGKGTMVSLMTPVPCGTLTGEGTCGRLATVAEVYEWRHPVYQGYLVMLPKCRACVDALVKLYGIQLGGGGHA